MSPLSVFHSDVNLSPPSWRSRELITTHHHHRQEIVSSPHIQTLSFPDDDGDDFKPPNDTRRKACPCELELIHTLLISTGKTFDIIHDKYPCRPSPAHHQLLPSFLPSPFPPLTPDPTLPHTSLISPISHHQNLFFPPQTLRISHSYHLISIKEHVFSAKVRTAGFWEWNKTREGERRRVGKGKKKKMNFSTRGWDPRDSSAEVVKRGITVVRQFASPPPVGTEPITALFLAEHRVLGGAKHDRNTDSSAPVPIS